MMRLTVAFEQFDVILVPFPYSDSSQAKKRPALILSGTDVFDGKIRHSICAMITSLKNRSWPFDIEIKDLVSAGLPAASVVRMKLFTLDHKIIVGKIGKLSRADQKLVKKTLATVLDMSP